MGGMGSGSYCRWSKKTTTKEVKRIDIREMKKRGWLEPRGLCSMSWTCGGEPSGDIRYQVNHEGLTLTYRSRSYGEDWQDIKERISFSRSACNFGGERLWFLCPHCGRRVAVLYGADARFLCRHCYDLPYATQMTCRLGRLIDKKHKLGYRIFEDYDGCGCQKRKGMHQKTFDRLYEQYWRLDLAIDDGITARFNGEAAL